MPLKQERIIMNKKRGETPLECILRYKKAHPKFEKIKMTYAGRLDPLAEGVLIILYGEECKNKEKYLKLDKEYEVEVLFGFATDTYDVLGKVTSLIYSNDTLWLFGKSHNVKLKQILQSFVGKFSQKYPPYSSKFFNKARSGELKDEEITSKNVEIKSIKFLSQKNISKSKLKKYVKDSIDLVQGDFRQNEILKIWNSILAIIPAKAGTQNSLNLDSRLHGNDKYQTISIKVKCTSGTYMRSLANEIGKNVGVPALALSIKRTKVGKFKL